MSMQKPIEFPDQPSEVKRVGPLFYWSWAVADKEAGIGLHPHNGFEMQTGSGGSHQESLIGQRALRGFKSGSSRSSRKPIHASLPIINSRTVNFQLPSMAVSKSRR